MVAPAPGPVRRSSIAAIVAAILVAAARVAVAFVAGRATTSTDRAARPERATGLVRTMLTARTQPGEAVGVIGAVAPEAVPEGRPVVSLDDQAVPAGERPRYVVAAGDRGHDATHEALGARPELLLAVPTTGAVDLRGYDTGRARSDRASSGGDPPASAPNASSAGGVVAPETAGADDTIPLDGDDPPAGDTIATGDHPASGAPQTVTVEAGDSFWSLAVELADFGQDPGAGVARYRTALIDANADQLVEPGNPDLLHVGQTLVLPATP